MRVVQALHWLRDLLVREGESDQEVVLQIMPLSIASTVGCQEQGTGPSILIVNTMDTVDAMNLRNE